jgi:hypothetical protein
MRRKPGLVRPEAHASRIAWWASFLATLALIAILGLARSAQALTLPPAGQILPGSNAATPAAPEEEEAEEEAEASEEGESEGEECESDDPAEQGECEAEAADEAPRECLLSTAAATISAGHDRVRLRLRYTAASPVAVAVDYGLHGAKGSLFLGSERKRVKASGVLSLSKQLSEGQMAKVLAARSFTVRLRALGAPGYCHSFFDRRLDVRRATPSGLSWSSE